MSSESCKIDLRAITPSETPGEVRDFGERFPESETEGFKGVNSSTEGFTGVDHDARLDLGLGNEGLAREKGLSGRECGDHGNVGLVDDDDSIQLGFRMEIDDAEVSKPQSNRDCGGLDVDDANVDFLMQTGDKHYNDGIELGFVMDADAKESMQQGKDDVGDFDGNGANVSLCEEKNKKRMEDIVAFEAGLSQEGNRYHGINLFVELNGSNIDEAIKIKSRPGVVDSLPTKSGSGGSMGSGTRFRVGDIVWGKVTSHPWWPGQIIDPSAASEKAKKYFKENSFLVMYFGDQSFAWNEASHLKPFREHFSQLEKQSNLGSFRYAVDCALEEVARQLENGLACSCTSKEVPSRIERQKIVNVGTGREMSRKEFVSSGWVSALFEPVKLMENLKKLAGSSVVCGDMLEFVELRASLLAFAQRKSYFQLPVLAILTGLFKPVKLVEHVKEIARSPVVGGDIMELKAYLSAFARWKGYSQLSVFEILSESWDKGSDVKIMEEEESLDKCDGNVSLDLCNQESMPEPMVTTDKANSRKCNNDSDDELHVFRKERRLSELMSDNSSQKDKLKRRIRRKSLSLLSGNKVNVSNSKIVKVKSEKGQSSPSTIKSTQPIQLDGGGRIDKSVQVTSNTNRSKPSCLRGNYHDIAKRGGKNRSLQANQTYPKPYISSPEGRKSILERCSSVQILSRLCMTAKNPTEGKRFLASLQIFISEFRNSFSVDHHSLLVQEKALEVLSSSEGVKDISILDSSELPEDQFITDSYWTDRLIQIIPGMQYDIRTSDEGVSLSGNQGEEGNCLYPVKVGLTDRIIHGFDPNHEPITKKHLNIVDSGVTEETDHTAFILNFTSLDSIPSKSKLNEIFGCYGPLVESETKVIRKGNRAKVLFKRRADAETAFSSAGKYTIFGPSLISYQLKYGPFAHQKSASRGKKRKRGA